MTAPSTGLAVVHDQRDPFSVMDSWDDEVLLTEMQGAIAKSLVYEFKQGGETITGLSKVGVDECCLVLSEQGQVIREEDITYVILGEGEKQEALFKAKAARYAVSPSGEMLLETVLGVKRQPLYDMRKGKLTLNPFWFETGAMKAVRNARFRLIPSKVREGVIAEAKRKGSVRSNRNGDVIPAKASPPAEPEKIEEARDPLPQGTVTPEYEEAEAAAMTELMDLLPSLAPNQQAWVREKLSNGVSSLDIMDNLREKLIQQVKAAHA